MIKPTNTREEEVPNFVASTLSARDGITYKVMAIGKWDGNEEGHQLTLDLASESEGRIKVEAKVTGKSPNLHLAEFKIEYP
ncbi:hypothetical protein OHV05_35060 [Kitasatospora sp. NBC_00070]|uniref:hypothetical protein n=1 Tax=Kitasatospora sp. NBC_00070 TaxID=2975962 RepID=UPI003253B9C3